jgi:hypothetical protein
MQITPKATGLALVVLSALALTGCVQQPSHVIPTSEPSVAPVFKSDAAALAAAKKAYLGYLAVSDEVAHDGGTDPQRFASVVTSSWLSEEKSSAAQLLSSGRKQVGVTRVTGVRLQETSQHGQVASVSIYACLDLSGVQYVDAQSGANAVPAPSGLVAIQVNFESSAMAPKHLLVERNTPWQGADFCPQS